MLYEGVTGETPFIGDTTIATLMARVGALLPEHDALGPLNDVLVWAAAPEPSERFDAAQFSLRLEELAATLPDPLPIAMVDAVPVDEAEGVEGAMVRPARRSVLGGSPPDATELGVLSGVGALTPEKPSAKEVKRAKAGRPSGRPAGARPGPPAVALDHRRRRGRRGSDRAAAWPWPSRPSCSPPATRCPPWWANRCPRLDWP